MMKIVVRLVFVSLLLSAMPLAAQSLDWSMAGSAGVLDDGTALGAFVLTGPYLGIRTDSVATAEARYPVTNTYGSVTTKTPAWSTFSMTYSDDSATAASVTAELMEVDKCSATERQVCSITSADGNGDPTCDVCQFVGGLDFANHAYYVHVTVAKTDIGVNPRLYALAIY